MTVGLRPPFDPDGLKAGAARRAADEMVLSQTIDAVPTGGIGSEREPPAAATVPAGRGAAAQPPATRSRRPSSSSPPRSGSGSSPTANSCRPSVSWPSGWGSAATRCARRSPRCASRAWSPPAGGVAAARVITYAGLEPGTGARRAHRRRARPTRSTSAGLSSPGPPALAATQSLPADQRAWLIESAKAAREAPDNAAHRLADSRLHLAIATLSGSPMLIEAVTRAQSALHELLIGDPGAAAQHRALQRPARGRSSRPSSAGTPTRRRATMEEHCDATAALLRGLLG